MNWSIKLLQKTDKSLALLEHCVIEHLLVGMYKYLSYVGITDDDEWL